MSSETLRFTEEQIENLKIWEELLLTTQLPQGKGRLRGPLGPEEDGPDGYCCLAIWANSRDSVDWIQNPVTGRWELRVLSSGCSGGMEFNLPTHIKGELGLGNIVPVINSGDHDDTQLERVFTYMNDFVDMTFAEIAAEIRHIIDHRRPSLRLRDRMRECGKGEFWVDVKEEDT